MVTPAMLEMFSAWLAPVKDKIPENLETKEAEALTSALSQEAMRRFSDFLEGVRFYQNATVQRTEANNVRVIWSSGTTRLWDYAPDSVAPIVLVIPSLVNRFEILDLDETRSFIRYLAGQGFRPLVVDWSEPGEEEKNFSLTDYITARLVPALDEAQKICQGQSIHVFGYCMGGLLALALAQLKKEQIKTLTLMAAPWDFAVKGVGSVPPASSFVGNLFLQQARQWLDCLKQVGVLPAPFLQAVFTIFQPLNTLQKYMRFAVPSSDDLHARRFILTEDWLNNGVPLALPVAQESLEDWYAENKTAKLEWTVAGEVIDPRKMSMPSYLIVPENDRVVPPESALPLASLLPQATLHQPPTGHLGVMVGEHAQENVWKPYIAWLKTK